MHFTLSLLILSAGLLNTFAASESIIPSKAEQANLLLNVQEVFEQVKLLIADESESTNIALEKDIQLMVKRALQTLQLYEETILLRLSCDSNSVCMLEFRPPIKQLAKEGQESLMNCTRRGSEDIKINSNQLANATNSAIDRGQLLLDALGNCSRKLGLAVISCYKNIIATDVVPVKRILLGAIEAHRDAHFKAVEIRDKANECVDDIVGKYKGLMEGLSDEAFHCF